MTLMFWPGANDVRSRCTMYGESVLAEAGEHMGLGARMLHCLYNRTQARITLDQVLGPDPENDLGDVTDASRPLGKR